MAENRDSIPLTIDFGSIDLFRILLYTALIFTSGYALFDFFNGSYGKAVMELLMFIGFLITTIMVSRGIYTRAILHLSVGTGVAGQMSMLAQFNEISFWAPTIAVSAFALLGKRAGACWSIFIGLCLLSIYLYDHLIGAHIFSHRMSVTSLLSFAVVMLVIYFYFKKAEEQALALLKETAKRERLEMAELLAGGIAHLINNEMQTVISRASLLKMQAPEAMMSGLDKIEKTGFTASRHANELLAFAKAGKYRSVVLNAGELLESAVNRIREEMPDSSVVIDLHRDAFQYYCKGDSDQLIQALANVVKNAVEVSPESGRVDIRIDRKELKGISDIMLPDGSYLVISVQDEGEGIPDASLDKIFDPFFSTKFTGRGLGLAAAFGIVKNHGGEIEVESEAGKGSTFRVWLRAEMENV
ncbi:MAG: ATP-binding protein [Mariprofundaceae bacterium]